MRSYCLLTRDKVKRLKGYRMSVPWEQRALVQSSGFRGKKSTPIIFFLSFSNNGSTPQLHGWLGQKLLKNWVTTWVVPSLQVWHTTTHHLQSMTIRQNCALSVGTRPAKTHFLVTKFVTMWKGLTLLATPFGQIFGCVARVAWKNGLRFVLSPFFSTLIIIIQAHNRRIFQEFLKDLVSNLEGQD